MIERLFFARTAENIWLSAYLQRMLKFTHQPAESCAKSRGSSSSKEHVGATGTDQVSNQRNSSENQANETATREPAEGHAVFSRESLDSFQRRQKQIARPSPTDQEAPHHVPLTESEQHDTRPLSGSAPVDRGTWYYSVADPHVRGSSGATISSQGSRGEPSRFDAVGDGRADEPIRGQPTDSSPASAISPV